MRIILIVAALSFALDQVSKLFAMQALALTEAGRIDVVPPFLRFIEAWNKGINFGIFASHEDLARWLLIGVALVISVALCLWARRKGGVYLPIGAGLVAGGALGNAVDRLRFGAVQDFLNMSCCGIDNPYVFNIADVTIFAGALLIAFTADKSARPGRGG